MAPRVLPLRNEHPPVHRGDRTPDAVFRTYAACGRAGQASAQRHPDPCAQRSHLRIVSGLAEGADQVVAQAGLDLGMEVEAVVAAPVGRYGWGSPHLHARNSMPCCASPKSPLPKSPKETTPLGLGRRGSSPVRGGGTLPSQQG